ncbi:MAG: M56 family metallopeptidase [Planctomycetaceae bacterium]
MNDFALSSQICWQITLTLLHVSWIGILIGLVAATGSHVLKNRSASVRYWLYSVSVLVFAASLPLTFSVICSLSVDDGHDVAHSPVWVATNAVTPPVLAKQEDRFSQMAPADTMALAPDKPSARFQPDRSVRSDRSDQSVGSDRSGSGPSAVWEKCQHIAKAAAPFVAALYFIGVLLMLIKLALGVRVSRRLRAASQPISDADLLSRMATQAKKLSLRVVPVIAYCEHVAVPIVIGLLRPMILVPAAMVNGLTTEQLESVLTHELAHLRRYDHLLIVVQRVLEAVLFFHPVTWYLSRRIHDEREICCDDLVLAIGGDRLQYALSLLRVAELRLAAAPGNNKSLTALAADGQRPSKLRQRIARLLGDSSNDSVRVSSLWLLAVFVGFVATSGWVINAMAAPAVIETPDEVTPDFESIKSLVEQAHTGPREIKTAHVRFRIARPGSGFQKGLTPEKCSELLESHDLVSSPDQLRSLLKAFVRNDEQLAEEPWSNVDLYLEGSKTRTTKSSSNHGPDYWVRDGNTTLRWDAANLQADLSRTTDDWIHEETLDYFLRLNYIVAKQIAQRKPTEIARDGDLLLLRYESGELTEETRISLLNGCVHSHTRSVNEAIVSEQLQLGWRRYNNVWLPSVVAELQYRRNQLDGCKLIVIEHASINSSVPAGIFTLGAPAGSVIVDKRDGLTQTYTINHDVYDLTSNEQLQAAMLPLSEELTADESAGVAEISRLYQLPDGVVLKHFGPPYSLARKYIGRMLGDRSVRFKQSINANLLTWDGIKFEHAFMHDGGSFSASDLALRFTGLGSAELEGDADLLELTIPGDFVYRKGASVDELLATLQEIVSDAAGSTVRIEFRDVERMVYRATGEFKLNLPGSLPYIAMNGGRHTGDFGESIGDGTTESLIRSLSAYIKTKIINEVVATKDELQWSERWYDLDSTRPEDRFVMDPEVVLQQITEQTGINFAEEKQKVRVLFIERDKGQGAAFVPAKSPEAASQPGAIRLEDIQPGKVEPRAKSSF